MAMPLQTCWALIWNIYQKWCNTYSPYLSLHSLNADYNRYCTSSARLELVAARPYKIPSAYVLTYVNASRVPLHLSCIKLDSALYTHPRLISIWYFILRPSHPEDGNVQKWLLFETAFRSSITTNNYRTGSLSNHSSNNINNNVRKFSYNLIITSFEEEVSLCISRSTTESPTSSWSAAHSFANLHSWESFNPLRSSTELGHFELPL